MPRACPIGIYSSSGFVNPTGGSRWIVQAQPTAHRQNSRNPTGGSRWMVQAQPAHPTTEQRSGLNNPPAPAGGIRGIFPVFGRSGLNDPPAPAGGIWWRENATRKIQKSQLQKSKLESYLIFDPYALRQGDASILSLRRAARGGETQTRPLWLSMVVLEELYVGAVDAKALKTFERMEREFVKVGRLLVPARREWSLAGQVLCQLGLKYGFDQVGRARLVNDALIAMSAANHGLTVLTKNPGDYQRLSEFRSFQWELIRA